MGKRPAPSDARPKTQHITSARHSSNCLSKKSVGPLAIYPFWPDTVVQRSGKSNPAAKCDTRCSAGLCDQSHSNRHSMPSCSLRKWCNGRLPLGNGTEEDAIRDGAGRKLEFSEELNGSAAAKTNGDLRSGCQCGAALLRCRKNGASAPALAR